MFAMVIAVLTLIVPVVGILISIYRDKLSPQGRIRKTKEVLEALDTVDQNNIPPLEEQRWSRDKERQQKELRKALKKMDSAKELRSAWAGFGSFALCTVVFAVALFIAGMQKGEMLVGNVVVSILIYVAAIVVAIFLGTLCWVTWQNVRDVKIRNGVQTKAEWQQVVADMNNRSRGGNTSEGA
ncbi:MAG: hypothetical protein L0I17_00435 [Actinomycetia bacterium]|nr:hypothetical protein [Actinomycetes bacterium]